MFLCLYQNPPELAKLGLDASKGLTDMVGTLLDIESFEATDRELSRADRVLGPATIICSSRLNHQKRQDCGRFLSKVLLLEQTRLQNWSFEAAPDTCS